MAMPADSLASSFNPSGNITKKPKIIIAGAIKIPNGIRRRLIRAVIKNAGMIKQRSRI